MDRIRQYQTLAPYFDNVDHADVKTIESQADLRTFIAAMLSYYPWWIVALYRIRELLVTLFGLVRHEKPEVLPSIRPEALAFQPGEPASFFIVRAARENTYWVSETPEDKHLQAFFGVVAEDDGKGRNRFHVFTTVRYRHWTGPVYFNLIRPFHHLVVWRMMKAGAGQ